MWSKQAAEGAGLGAFDPELAHALTGERERQERFIELIASENYASPYVLETLGSTLTNKYADGYPGRRQYSGCEFVDVAETLAIERAQLLFGAGYANVQPYSGSQANEAAYFALLEPGETLLSMDQTHGGHVTHGSSRSFSGRSYRAVRYGVDTVSGSIDYDRVRELARAHKPKLIVAGFSAYPRIVDWQVFRAIADEVEAYLLVDMAHVAGLVAAGLYPDPVRVADVVTSTTHKTLRGPRGGLILARNGDGFRRRLDRGVYPGIQGGPLMHVVAAKAVAFREALTPEFRIYQQRVLANARRMAEVFSERGLAVWTGGTDNHMVMLDLAPREQDAARAVEVLEAAHIAVSQIRVPGSYSEVASGLRLGTPAITTRGFGESEAGTVADWIADLLDAPDSARVVESVRQQAEALCRAFPVYT